MGNDAIEQRYNQAGAAAVAAGPFGDMSGGRNVVNKPVIQMQLEHMAKVGGQLAQALQGIEEAVSRIVNPRPVGADDQARNVQPEAPRPLTVESQLGDQCAELERLVRRAIALRQRLNQAV